MSLTMRGDHSNTPPALSQDAQSVNRENGMSYSSSRDNIKGITLDRVALSSDDCSVTTIGTDFSISKSVLQAFGDAFGRDSRILTRERSECTNREQNVPVIEQPVTRRQSRGSIRGIAPENMIQKSDMSVDDTTLDDSEIRGIAQAWGHHFGRDSRVVTRDRSMRRSSAGSIAGITIDVAELEDDSEDSEALDNDTNAEGHDCGVELDGSMYRVTSDLSMCSILEDEVATESQLRVETPLKNSSSLLRMSGQRISDRDVKAGAFSRTLSMAIGKSGHHKPRRTISYHHKSSNRVSSCLSIDGNAEVTCSKNASFQDWMPPNLSHNFPRPAATSSAMGHALLNAQSPSLAATRLNSNYSMNPSLNSQRSAAASSMGHALLNMPPSSTAGTHMNPHISQNLSRNCQRAAAASSMGRALLNMPSSS